MSRIGNKNKPKIKLVNTQTPEDSHSQIGIVDAVPKIILSNSFVDNYIVQQKGHLHEAQEKSCENLLQNLPAESSNNSVEVIEPIQKDDDVVFVAQATASKEIRDIIKLNRKVAKLTIENQDLRSQVKSLKKLNHLEAERRRLEQEVADLQDVIQSNVNNSVQTIQNVVNSSNSSMKQTTDEMEMSRLSGFSEVLGDTDVQHQLNAWKENGEFDKIVEELQEFIKKNVK